MVKHAVVEVVWHVVVVVAVALRYKPDYCLVFATVAVGLGMVEGQRYLQPQLRMDAVAWLLQILAR